MGYLEALGIAALIVLGLVLAALVLRGLYLFVTEDLGETQAPGGVLVGILAFIAAFFILPLIAINV